MIKIASVVQLIVCFLMVNIVFSGCSFTESDKSGTDAEKKASVKYFNFKQYITTEIARLNTAKTGLQKTVSWEAKSETNTLQNPDWGMELAAFSEIDLNKANLRDAYIVDSSVKPNKSLFVSYKAKKATEEIQNIQFNYLPNDTLPIAIQIVSKGNNLLYNQYNEMGYMPQQGFFIKTEQKLLWKAPTIISIGGNFIAP